MIVFSHLYYRPTKPKKSKEEQEIDDKIDKKEFLEIGSATATMRLIKDLKNIQKGDQKSLVQLQQF